MSAVVRPCHPETRPDTKFRIGTITMGAPVIKEGRPSPVLADIDAALQKCSGLPPVRVRDLRSAVSRVAALLGDDPARITLDIRAIGAKLAELSPTAVGLSPKSLANIRANFMGAVETSGLVRLAPAKKIAPVAGMGPIDGDASRQ